MVDFGRRDGTPKGRHSCLVSLPLTRASSGQVVYGSSFLRGIIVVALGGLFVDFLRGSQSAGDKQGRNE